MRRDVIPESVLGFQGALVARHLFVGLVLCEPRDIDVILARYCRTIFVENDDIKFQFSLRGSGAAIRIYNRNILFCTNHQIKDCDPSSIYMQSGSSQNFISSARMSFPSVDLTENDEDFVDCRAFTFQDESPGGVDLSNDFFPSQPSRMWPSNGIDKFIIFGYPYELQNVDYISDVPEIGRKKIF